MMKILAFITENLLGNHFNKLKAQFEVAWEIVHGEKFEDYRPAFNNSKKIILIEWSPRISLEILLKFSPMAKVFFLIPPQEFSLEDRQKLGELCLKEKWIQGVIDFNNPIEWSVPALKSIIEGRQLEAKAKEVSEISRGLNQLIFAGLNDLQRAKSLHSLIVTQRKEQFKNLKIISKYAAGESPGSEFFDVISSENELIVFLSSSNSYLASSVTFNFFERLKKETRGSLKDYESMLLLMADELKKIDTEIKADILLMRVDLKTLAAEGLNFGGARLISEKAHYINANNYPVAQGFMEKAYFNFKLKRSERSAIISPGISKNISGDLIGKKEMAQFFSHHLATGATETLNELFFELKRKKRSDFLDYDACVLIFEVDENAILKL